MVSKETLKKYRELIVEHFKTTFLGTDGFPVFKIDSQTGAHIDKSSLLPELGDYLPFLLYYGDEAFVNNQISLAKKHFQKQSAFIWNAHTRLPKHSWVFEYSDLLLGLLQCEEIMQSKKSTKKGEDRDYLKTAEKVFDFVQNNFYKNGYIRTHYFDAIKGTLPLTSSLSCMFCEIYVDFYLRTKDTKYLEHAKKITQKMIDSTGFQKYGIFQTYYPTNSLLRTVLKLVSLARQYDATKYNIAASQALIALYGATKDKYYEEQYFKWFTGMKTFLRYPQGGYAAKVYLSGSKKSPKAIRSGGPELRDFHILESYCDMYNLSPRKEYLEAAKDIADYWTAKMGETGLLPFVHDGKQSWFDSEIDFSIGLGKLYEISKEKKYKDFSMKIIDAVFKHHYLEYGMASVVDINTGKLIDSQVDTRFLTLSFKAILMLESDYKTYKSPLLTSLLRDR